MKVLNIKENPDGSADMTYELNFKDMKLFKKLAKDSDKEFSDRFCNKIILKSIKDMIKRETSLNRLSKNYVVSNLGPILPSKKQFPVTVKVKKIVKGKPSKC